MVIAPHALDHRGFFADADTGTDAARIADRNTTST